MRPQIRLLGALSLCSLILLLGSLGAPMVATAGAFATAQNGACALVVASDGSIYTSVTGTGSCNLAQGPWTLAGNVGSGAADEVIGMNSKLEVLTSSGNEYQLALGNGCASVAASLVGNVFEITDVLFGNDPFVAFGDSNGGHVYAVTALGRVFRRNVTGCSPTTWEYSGALPVGPTVTAPASWGAVKVHYR